MENILVLNYIEKKGKTVVFKYSVLGRIKKLFTTKRVLELEYDFNLDKIPNSILVIPFLGNFLPLSWVFNFVIKVPEVDKSFYNQINKIKNGYKKMYTNISFLGRLDVNDIKDNRKKIKKRKEAVLFSGGVDAYLTVLENYNKKPMLINVQGSELDIDNKLVINEMKEVLLSQAEELNLPITFAKTTFRKLLNEDIINLINYKQTSEPWWHGFQHGLAIITHAAPITFYYNIDKLYISSSYTRGEIYKCASDPTIDNYVKFGSCITNHYGYDYTRQDKIKKICIISNEKKINTYLRVCFQINQVNNCCHCEKCYRTIFALISLGYDPNKYGFIMDDNFYKRAERFFKYRLLLNDQSKYVWIIIQNEMKKSNNNDENLKWFLNYDFNQNKNIVIKYLIKYYFAIMKRIRKIGGKK